MKEKKKYLNKAVVLLLCVALLGGMFDGIPCVKKALVTDVEAASFNDINASNVFQKQASGSVTCTLVAASMLVRRAAMMNGNSSWSSISEYTMESTAWAEGQGMRNSFTYAGISVGCGYLNSSKTQTLINLLASHPEGIVLYDYQLPNSTYPHAILITDYTNGTFYCADPSPSYPSGRIPLSQSSFSSVENAEKYWYVTSPKVGLSNTDNVAPVVNKIETYNVKNDSFSVKCTASDNVGVTKINYYCWGEGDAWDRGGICKETTATNGTSSTTITLKELNKTIGGNYYIDVLAYDAAGNVSATKGISVYVDKTAPTVNKIESFNVKNDRFSVKCTASDNVGVTKINYYCWGEGDAWNKGGICKETTATNGTSSTTITLKELNKTAGGNYYIDVLAYDAAGNVSATKGIAVYVDKTIPSISNIKVYDITETGYTISCTATDNVGISRVQFPTWTEKDWQDDLLKDWGTNTKLKGTANGNTYTFRVNISEHNNEYGTYITHIYAYDKAGNYKKVDLSEVTVEGPSDSQINDGKEQPQVPSGESDTEIGNQDNTELSSAEKEKIRIIKKKKATISSLKNKKGKKVVVTIKKVKYADGYEIKYSTSSKFKKNVKKVKTESLKKTLKKLKKGKTYYVKVRPYYKDSLGRVTYGKYGKVKRVKIRK